MPRGVYNRKSVPAADPQAARSVLKDIEPVAVDDLFEELRATLEAKKAQFEMAAARIEDVLASFNPKPRLGRPPKAGR